MRIESIIRPLNTNYSRSYQTGKTFSVQPFTMQEEETEESVESTPAVNLLMMLQSHYGWHPSSQMAADTIAPVTSADPHATGTAHPVVVDLPEPDPVVPQPVSVDPHATGTTHPVVVDLPEPDPVVPQPVSTDPHATGTAHPVVVDLPEPDPVVPQPVSADPHVSGTAHPIVIDQPEPNPIFTV